jgi:hypothetical protein
MLRTMRTTLSIDGDLMSIASDIARREHRPVGAVISDRLRESFTIAQKPFRYRNGVPLLPIGPNAGRATLELVNRLRDETE